VFYLRYLRAELLRRRGRTILTLLGLAIGVGGIAAALMGLVADAYGLRTVMWLIVAVAVPMVVLARTLPVTRAERRAQGAASAAAASMRGAGGPAAPAPGAASPRPSG